MLKKYLETGKIVGTHGVKGMVRVQPWSDSGEFLTNFKYFYLDKNGETKISDRALTALALLIAESRPSEKGLLVALICKLLEN